MVAAGHFCRSARASPDPGPADVLHPNACGELRAPLGSWSNEYEPPGGRSFDRFVRGCLPGWACAGTFWAGSTVGRRRRAGFAGGRLPPRCRECLAHSLWGIRSRALPHSRACDRLVTGVASGSRRPASLNSRAGYQTCRVGSSPPRCRIHRREQRARSDRATMGHGLFQPAEVAGSPSRAALPELLGFLSSGERSPRGRFVRGGGLRVPASRPSSCEVAGDRDSVVDHTTRLIGCSARVGTGGDLSLRRFFTGRQASEER